MSMVLILQNVDPSAVLSILFVVFAIGVLALLYGLRERERRGGDGGFFGGDGPVGGGGGNGGGGGGG